ELTTALVDADGKIMTTTPVLSSACWTEYEEERAVLRDLDGDGADELVLAARTGDADYNAYHDVLVVLDLEALDIQLREGITANDASDQEPFGFIEILRRDDGRNDLVLHIASLDRYCEPGWALGGADDCHASFRR